MTQVWPQYQWY